MRSPSRAQLNEWVAEATVDCYNESECITAFYTTLEERLGLPFEAEVLGVAVMVESIDLTDDEQIVAVCERGGTPQRISILDLPLSAPPGGAEWIEAYRHWARGRCGDHRRRASGAADCPRSASQPADDVGAVLSGQAAL